MNALVTGLRGLSGSGAGLSPSDPCYDPNNSWYNTFWTSNAECACMAANPSRYDIHQQCVDYQPGGIVGGVATAAGLAVSDITGGVASGVLASSLAVPALSTIAIVGGLALLGLMVAGKIL